jgi:hypothetical protein
MSRTEKVKYPHWNYFLALELDLIGISRYIEFNSDNLNTYSIENAKLILSTCSEIDVICKKLCQKFSNRKKGLNISIYREILVKNIPKIVGIEVSIPRYGVKETPWDSWTQNKRPDFWAAYNNIKHNLVKHKSGAELKHAINAMAALFILNLYLYKDGVEFGEFGPSCELFFAEDLFVGSGQSKFGPSHVYKLP